MHVQAIPIPHWQKAVTLFHHRMGIPSRLQLDVKDPALCDQVPRALLIVEEGLESVVAMMRGDLTKSVDGLIDFTYVCLGSLDRWGIDATEQLVEIDKELGYASFAVSHRFFKASAESSADEILKRTLNINRAILTNQLTEAKHEINTAIFEAVDMLISWGVSPQPFFGEVHRTNMKKSADGFDPLTGKIHKPQGWKPPRIAELLQQQGA